MSFPAARVGDLSATGDAILPPGFPNVLIGGLPAACVGDTVYGPVINYAPGIIATGGFTVLIGGRPAARVTSMVNGLTIGPLGVPVPVATTIVKGQLNVLIGDMGVAVPPPPQVQAQLTAMDEEVKRKKAELEKKKS
jgi:uncharacterized Zn-binding protein involved in type VI secretion